MRSRGGGRGGGRRDVPVLLRRRSLGGRQITMFRRSRRRRSKAEPQRIELRLLGPLRLEGGGALNASTHVGVPAHSEKPVRV